MNSYQQRHQRQAGAPRKQEGVVLFYALIGLVVLLLAAVALIRSVDTATVISGNLSFRQAATSSGDAGIERAMGWLNTNINSTDTNNAAVGYYSGINVLDLENNVTADATWQDGVSAEGGADASGNTVRYVIERMCRTPGVAPSEEDCLYSDDPSLGGSQRAGELSPYVEYQSLVFRVTIRVTGPRNTVSYIQGFVY